MNVDIEPRFGIFGIFRNIYEWVVGNLLGVGLAVGIFAIVVGVILLAGPKWRNSGITTIVGGVIVILLVSVLPRFVDSVLSI